MNSLDNQASFSVTVDSSDGVATELGAATAVQDMAPDDRRGEAASYFSVALYAGLAMDGLTRWEWAAVVSSAAIGFVSFLLFVGYGYFDPLHFGLTAGLLPTFFLTLKDRPPRALPPPDLHNDRAWKRAQTGQLLLVSAAGPEPGWPYFVAACTC